MDETDQSVLIIDISLRVSVFHFGWSKFPKVWPKNNKVPLRDKGCIYIVNKFSNLSWKLYFKIYKRLSFLKQVLSAKKAH